MLAEVLVVAGVLAGVHVALFWRSSRPGSGRILRTLRFIWLDFWASASPFYLSLLMLFIFALWLGVLPTGSASQEANLLARLRHLIIPILALSIVPAMVLTSKGLREMEARFQAFAGRRRWLLLGHMALFTVAEFLRMVGLLLSLAVLVGHGGISRTLFTATVWVYDAPMVVGIAWVMVIMVVVSRLLADLVQVADGYLLRRAGVGDDVPVDTVPQRSGPRFLLVLALVVFGGLAVLALFSPWTAGYGMNDQSLYDRLASPGKSHLLGADYVGRDLFSRLIHALRFEYIVGLIALAGVTLASAPWSALAIWLRGKRAWPWRLGHEAVMWPVHVLTTFPWMALAALVFVYNYGILGTESRPRPDGSVPMFIIALLLVLVPRGVRMCIECFGATSTSLTLRRRAIASAAVLVPMAVAAAVFMSINLGFIGLGFPPPRPSLGLIFFDMRDYIGSMAIVTLVCVPLAGVLLVSSLLWTGEYLLDRMGVRSGSVWSRGLE
jgi:peptide/nickel transport system permease protein